MTLRNKVINRVSHIESLTVASAPECRHYAGFRVKQFDIHMKIDTTETKLLSWWR